MPTMLRMNTPAADPTRALRFTSVPAQLDDRDGVEQRHDDDQGHQQRYIAPRLPLAELRRFGRGQRRGEVLRQRSGPPPPPRTGSAR